MYYAIWLQLWRLVIGLRKYKWNESVLDSTRVESPSGEARSFTSSKIPAPLRVNFGLTILERE